MKFAICINTLLNVHLKVLKNPMPAPLQLHGTASLPVSTERILAGFLVGNQRCLVSRERKGNEVYAMFVEVKTLVERFCEVKRGMRV